jgi:hypothetical protein
VSPIEAEIDAGEDNSRNADFADGASPRWRQHERPNSTHYRQELTIKPAIMLVHGAFAESGSWTA